VSYTIRVVQTVSEGSTSLSSTTNTIVEGCDKRNETIVDAASEYNVVIGIDVSSLKVFSMKSSQVLTVKTNSSGSPQETFTLVAGRPIVWQEGDAAIFAGDVTGLYVSNASGNDAVLEIISATDTP